MAGVGWGWGVFALLCAGLALTPALALWHQALGEDVDQLWQHVQTVVLGRYVLNTVVLLLCSAFGALLVGVVCAWLTVACSFKGQALLRVGLLLPLGMPPYLAALFYTEFLDYAGPVQKGLRGLFGWQGIHDYWFPEVRSLGGAALFFTATLYPYVLLLVRHAFLSQGQRYLEVGRSLGASPWGCFFRVAFPLAKPAMAIGMLLVMMEVLADFGVADFFATPTLSVGLHRLWFNLGAQAAGGRLALLALLLAWVLFSAERFLVQKRSSTMMGCIVGGPLQPFVLRGWRAGLAWCVCAAPCVIGFIVPLAVMVSHVSTTYTLNPSLPEAHWHLALNSIVLAAMVASLCLVLGAALAYALRVQPRALIRWALTSTSMGYATPSVALAVGVLVVFGVLERNLQPLWLVIGQNSPLFAYGAPYAALFMALILRFLAVPCNATQSALQNITHLMDDAARSLGAKLGAVLWRVHIPATKGALFAGWLLVFVETMKELPITLLLRPFGFETLAVKAYEYASYESYREAAWPALLVILVGLGPVLVLSHYMLMQGEAKRHP